MAISDNFTITISGDIVLGEADQLKYTILELHRWLQDAADGCPAYREYILINGRWVEEDEYE